MTNFAMSKRVNLRIFPGMLVSVALALSLSAQAPRQLRVEVGPDQQIRVLASGVSYGEVLRALQKKLGWEIEIPALADELKISYVRVESTEPPIVLDSLLGGSPLGYALLNRSQSVKAVVTPRMPGEASVTHETVGGPAIPDSAKGEASFTIRKRTPAVTPGKPNAAAAGTKTEQGEVSATMPLTEAISAIGVPPDDPPADVGRAITLPISEAINAMGVPPGMSPGDVGKTTVLPLPTGPGTRP